MIHSNVFEALTLNQSIKAALPLITLGVPFLGALVIGCFFKKDRLRNGVSIITYLLTFSLILSMYPFVIKGIKIGSHFYKGIELIIPSVLGMKLNLGLDAMGFLFALITALVWTLSSVFAISYMSREHARGRFLLFMLLTFGANIAVFLSRDLFSLFIFFELMTIFSYVLVVHEESEEAMSAGRLYLLISIIGGLLILVSTVVLYFYTGTSALQPMAGLVSSNLTPLMRNIIMAGFIIGFGIKAGMFFLHVWLPEAHPIAPTPASAILSGLIVKVGIYGIIRSIYILLTPITFDSKNIMIKTGYFLIWAGIITMFLGMIRAAMEKNCKRVLAYSTVSQMGYIIMGIGCALYLGSEGAMGLAGSLYHVINHALFKAALFLTIGVIFFYTRELHMDHLGELWKRFPFTAVVYLIAGLSIAGFPGFGGFASKTMLHHAIVEAYQHSAHFSAFHQPDLWLKIAELIFLITASGTIYYIGKMFIEIFILPPSKPLRSQLPKETWAMRIALLAFSLLIIGIGIWPNLILEYLIGPTLSIFGFNPDSHAYHLIFNTHISSGIRSTLPLLYDPHTYSIFTPQVIHNLGNVVIILSGTIIYFILDYGPHVFDISIPSTISLVHLYTKGYEYFIAIFSILQKGFDTCWDRVISFIMVNAWLTKNDEEVGNLNLKYLKYLVNSR